MSIKKRLLKIGLAVFASIFLIIGLVIPYRLRMKYCNALVRFKNAVKVMF